MVIPTNRLRGIYRSGLFVFDSAGRVPLGLSAEEVARVGSLHVLDMPGVLARRPHAQGRAVGPGRAARRLRLHGQHRQTS